MEYLSRQAIKLRLLQTQEKYFSPMLEYLRDKCEVEIWRALGDIFWAQVSFDVQLLCLRKYHLRPFLIILCFERRLGGMLWSESFDTVGIGLTILSSQACKIID